MKRGTLVVACALCLGAQGAFAQDDSRAREFMEMTRKPLQYELQPERVTVHEDVRIGSRADGSAFTIDLYVPQASATAPLPVALLVHGGLPDGIPVLPTAWRAYKDWGTVLAQSGVAAVMFDHRLGYPKHRVDEAMSEIDQIVRWLKQPASERGPASVALDAARMHAVTFSAGGLLVPEIARRHPQFAGFVLFYPLLGTDASADNDARTAERLTFINVLPVLAQRRTPLLIFRAGADEIPGLLQRLDATLAAALKADANFELVNLPGAPHAFDFLRDAPDTRAAIRRTILRAGGRTST